MKRFLKKNWSDILFLLIIMLLIVPQTRMPIQVFVQRVISFSPSIIDEDDRVHLNDYNWDLSELNGEAVNFSSSQGKVVLLNFWATWCPPCVAELPSMQALYKKHKNKVDFYFITNEDPTRIVQFLDKHGYEIPIYFELGATPEILNSGSLPTTFLISGDGEIMIRKTGAANWDSEKINKLIKELTK